MKASRAVMSVSRLEHITKIGVEQMGDLADRLADPSVLRLENLDTDLRPPQSALDFTRRAIDDDAANSYLPFFGLDSMRQAATALVGRQSGHEYDWKTECVISAGGLSGILNVLLATLEPGDEVLMTDPTYVGLINRVRLAGGVPRFVASDSIRPGLEAGHGRAGNNRSESRQSGAVDESIDANGSRFRRRGMAGTRRVLSARRLLVHQRHGDGANSLRRSLASFIRHPSLACATKSSRLVLRPRNIA